MAASGSLSRSLDCKASDWIHKLLHFLVIVVAAVQLFLFVLKTVLNHRDICIIASWFWDNNESKICVSMSESAPKTAYQSPSSLLFNLMLWDHLCLFALVVIRPKQTDYLTVQ